MTIPQAVPEAGKQELVSYPDSSAWLNRLLFESWMGAGFQYVVYCLFAAPHIARKLVLAKESGTASQFLSVSRTISLRAFRYNLSDDNTNLQVR